MTSWARESSSSSTGPEKSNHFIFWFFEVSGYMGHLEAFSFLKYHIHEFGKVKYKLFIYLNAALTLLEKRRKV
jgi:hypothetical protein